MEFKKLADYFQKLEKTSSRLEITRLLSSLFKEAKADEIAKVCYLSLGRLTPLYESVEFNLAERMMFKVIGKVAEKDGEKIKEEFKEKGDLGEVVFENHKGVKDKNLSVEEVYQRLFEVAKEEGAGSVKRKVNKMAELLVNLDNLSAKYVVRVPLGKLRLGFSDATLLDALSWMMTGDKSKREEIESAYNVQADVGKIAEIVKTSGLKNLGKVRIALGTPIMPALPQRLPTAEEMLEKVGVGFKGKVAVEPKYDGTRLQIHFSDKLVRIFTRNLENVTEMFPDLKEVVLKEVKAKIAILDGEAIGFDPQTGKFLPFQETIKRKRKYGIGQKAKEVPLKFFVFDIFHKDGKDLMPLPFEKRRQILEKMVSSDDKTIILSPQIVTDNPRELREYHDEQIKKGLEGVMVKKLKAPYEPGRRGYTWVKFKSEKGKKGAGLTDTLDCVVMGYYKGRGKRAGFGIGAFLVGIRKKGQILSISKVGTGLTDEQWREMRVRSEKCEVRSEPKEYLVDKNLAPDVWCLPKIVVEIEADNITKSPIHASKYALRFPRLVRFRDDKSPDQATTLKETEKLYKLQ